jgi:hypothetical protein
MTTKYAAQINQIKAEPKKKAYIYTYTTSDSLWSVKVKFKRNKTKFAAL